MAFLKEGIANPKVKVIARRVSSEKKWIAGHVVQLQDINIIEDHLYIGKMLLFV
jgi:hypothetical protein